ncbi:hypothetical protein JOS77_00910 [Chromobacterium haemolyticum]|nr:hypothetical protein JOS77_00910 [Chromobacterium haemolyticum]
MSASRALIELGLERRDAGVAHIGPVDFAAGDLLVQPVHALLIAGDAGQHAVEGFLVIRRHRHRHGLGGAGLILELGDVLVQQLFVGLDALVRVVLVADADEDVLLILADVQHAACFAWRSSGSGTRFSGQTARSARRPSGSATTSRTPPPKPLQTASCCQRGDALPDSELT